MNNNSLREAEFQQTLNNFNNLEDIEFYEETLSEQRDKMISNIDLDIYVFRIYSLEIDEELVELDENIVIAEIKQEDTQLEYIGNKFQNNYDALIEAINEFEFAMYNLPEDLQKQYETVSKDLLLKIDTIKSINNKLKTENMSLTIYINYSMGDQKIKHTLDEFLRIHQLVIIKN